MCEGACMKRIVPVAGLFCLYVFVLTAASFADPFTDRGLARAVCVVRDRSPRTFSAVRRILEANGARGLIMYPYRAVYCYIPSDLDERDFPDLPVTVARSAQELPAGEIGTVTHHILTGLFSPEAVTGEKPPTGGYTFDDEVLTVPEEIVEMTKVGRPMVGAPAEVTSRGINQNSEFMIGTVLINVVFPESAGSGEDWTDDEISNAVRDVYLGLSLFQQKAHWVELNFIVNYEEYRRVPVGIEPIMTNFYDGSDLIWISDAMRFLGYEPGGYHPIVAVHALNNATRNVFKTDWVFTVFIADQSAHHDPEPPYPDPGCWGGAGYTAYAFLGGPYMVVPYPGCRLGYGVGFGQLFDHEMGHIFWALDEYQSANVPCSFSSGYLDVENGNSYAILLGQQEPCGDGLECVMASASFPDCPVCPYTMGQIGLADVDENSIPDIYEVPPSVKFIDVPGVSEDTVYSNNSVMAARAWNEAVPNQNPQQNDGSRIHYAPRLVRGVYWINNGLDTEMMPTDRKWDAAEEDLGFLFSGLTPGLNTVHVKVENCVGLTAEATRDIYYIGIQFIRTFAKVEIDHININWITAKEVFGARFEVEREDLTSGSGRRTITVVDTFKSTGGSQNHYEFSDETIMAGHEYRYQIIAKFTLGIPGHSEEYIFKSQKVEKTAMIPVESNLASHLLPNPTSGRTSFTVDIPKSYYDPTGGSRSGGVFSAPARNEVMTPVDIAVYNILGQRVVTIYTRSRYGGLETFTWDGCFTGGNQAPPGVYFIKIRAGDKQEVKKAVVIR
jgi:hypothetical protein